MLAIVFGCVKFHDYIYGLPNVTVETDHKPLETILTKPLHAAPARLQRIIMSIQKYPIHVVYKPGKELLIADTLSRAPLPQQASELEFQQYDINILHTLPITEPKLAELKEQTNKDTTLCDLTKTVQDGWPETKADALPGAKPFWNYRDEITYHHGVLFKGSKVIIPSAMQANMLKLVHNSHLGVEKCKRHAKDVMFWPEMAAQITDVVLNCHTCSTHQRRNAKEPLLSHPTPSRPWERIAADLCEVNGQHYLVMVDYYSNFIEVDRLSETTSEKIIECCKCQFARYGIPDTFVSDNGPQFSSYKFRHFSENYQFKHHTSSPHYPQSNGKAEKAVQTVKNLLQKSMSEQKDFQLALLDFRNTPTNDTLGSPSQRLMGRRTKTLLPTTAKLLAPKTIQPANVRANLLSQKSDQMFYYDYHSKTLSVLNKGEKVMFQCGRMWKPAVIKDLCSDPRSYIITTPDGQEYRRNPRHLRPTQADFD